MCPVPDHIEIVGRIFAQAETTGHCLFQLTAVGHPENTSQFDVTGIGVGRDVGWNLVPWAAALGEQRPKTVFQRIIGSGQAGVEGGQVGGSGGIRHNRSRRGTGADRKRHHAGNPVQRQTCGRERPPRQSGRIDDDIVAPGQPRQLDRKLLPASQLPPGKGNGAITLPGHRQAVGNIRVNAQRGHLIDGRRSDRKTARLVTDIGQGKIAVRTVGHDRQAQVAARVLVVFCLQDTALKDQQIPVVDGIIRPRITAFRPVWIDGRNDG